MLSTGQISPDEANELLHAVWERLSDFYKQIEAAKAVQEAKAEK